MSGRRVTKQPLHRSLDYGRLKFDRARTADAIAEGKDGTPSLEVVFAEQWEQENKASPGINFGHGILQDLMCVRDRWGNAACRMVIRRRDAAIAATVVQWLGTNVGGAFLERCLHLAGYALVHPHQLKREEEREALREWQWTLRNEDLAAREKLCDDRDRAWLEQHNAMLGGWDTEIERLFAVERAARATRERMVGAHKLAGKMATGADEADPDLPF